MGGVEVKNGLGEYLERLKKYKNRFKSEKITRLVGSIGVETAREEYSASGVTPEDLRAEVRDNGVDIVATGEHLAFSEFGTGTTGKGTYEVDGEKGKLPTQTLIFDSHGKEQQTQGWEYNYYKEQNKDINPNIPDFTGIRANAQMFKTSRRLQEELPSEIRKEIKGEN